MASLFVRRHRADAEQPLDADEAVGQLCGQILNLATDVLANSVTLLFIVVSGRIEVLNAPIFATIFYTSTSVSALTSWRKLIVLLAGARAPSVLRRSWGTARGLGIETPRMMTDADVCLSSVDQSLTVVGVLKS